MSMQSEGEDVKGREDQRSTPDGVGGTDSAGTTNTGATKGPVADNGGQQSGPQDSQQGAMPPSQTDDDQYDQGTVQRES